MTIYRVKLTDEPKVVKSIKAEEPAVVKYYQKHDKDYDLLYSKFSKWIEQGFAFEKDCLKILADARKGYTMADKKLKELGKDKKANKEKIAEMIKLRKYFYDCGNEAKSMANLCKPY